MENLLTQFISKFDDPHSFASMCVSIVTANFDTLYAGSKGQLNHTRITSSLLDDLISMAREKSLQHQTT